MKRSRINIAASLACLPEHLHAWEASAHNKFGVQVEQTCTCGARRHFFYADMTAATQRGWRNGPHPAAELARKETISEE